MTKQQRMGVRACFALALLARGFPAAQICEVQAYATPAKMSKYADVLKGATGE